MSRTDQIVFINQSSGYLMIDLVNAFRDHYQRRVLFTGFLNPRAQQLDSDVKVERLIRYDRSSDLKRMITWVVALLKSLYLILTKYRRAHLFMISNPPLVVFIPLLARNSYSLLIYDIFPDALVTQGIFQKNSLIVRIWERVNRSVMRRATKVYTVTDGMKKVISSYVDESKIEVIPIWTDNQFLRPIPKSENIFIRENGFEGKFLIIYSGNLGSSHSIEAIVDVAERVSRPDIQFLIIGDGAKGELIRQRIAGKGLKNCILMPWQETKMLPYSLSAADLAVVTLNKGGSHHAIPSKVFGLMSVGVPVLCIADPSSDLALMLRRYEMGECFEDADIDKMADYVIKIADDNELRKKLKSNSLHASRNFTSDNASKFVHSSSSA